MKDAAETHPKTDKERALFEVIFANCGDQAHRAKIFHRDETGTYTWPMTQGMFSAWMARALATDDELRALHS